MMRSLRVAGLFCGALVSGGLVGCDTAEISQPVADRAPTSVTTRVDVATAPPTAADSSQAPATNSQLAAASQSAPKADPASAEKQPAADAKIPAASGAPPRQALSAPPADRPRFTPKASGKPGEVQEITFDTIKFPMEKEQAFVRSMLTPQVVALDGQPVRIRGYILPSFQQTGITQFVLVRDNLQCCFGPGAALFDCIIVEMRPGKSADYTVRPVSVEGKFTLAELVNPDDGKHLAIYHLDGEKVQ